MYNLFLEIYSRSHSRQVGLYTRVTATMDDTKSVSIIKYLCKFGGKEAEYADWRYTTLRTIGLHKPDIANLLSGTWVKPVKEYDLDYHRERDHDDDGVRSGAAVSGAGPSTTSGEDNELSLIHI